MTSVDPSAQDGIVKLTKIVWVAFVLSTAAQGFLLAPSLASGGLPNAEAIGGPSGLKASSPLVLILAAMAAVSAVVAFLVPTLLASDGQLKRVAARAKSANTPVLLRLLNVWFTARVVQWAMLEVISVFGLVCAAATRSIETYYPFGVAAVVLMLAARPQVDIFMARARRLASDAT